MSHTPLVLCAVDFSPPSADIVRIAAACAGGAWPDGDGRAALTLVHVVEPLLVQAAAMTVDSDVIQSECRQALAALASSVTSTALAQPATLDVRVGLPHVEILKAAAASHATLIVLGTQGQTGAARFFFGSTTQRVLRETVMLMLVVPPAASPICARRRIRPGTRHRARHRRARLQRRDGGDRAGGCWPGRARRRPARRWPMSCPRRVLGLMGCARRRAPGAAHQTRWRGAGDDRARDPGAGAGRTHGGVAGRAGARACRPRRRAAAQPARHGRPPRCRPALAATRD